MQKEFRDKVIGKKWIYLERKTLHRQSTGHCRGQAWPGVLISDSVDFSARTVTRDKDKHYTNMKGSSYQGDITFLNMSVLTSELQNT